MHQETRVGLLRERAGQWNQLSTPSKRFDLSTLTWRKALLYIFFSLLFVLVILVCIIIPSPFVAAALIVALGVAALALLRPRFALLLVFTGVGLPSLLLPLPGHTMRLVEPALLLCLLAVVMRRSHMRLRLPHLLALFFLAIAAISFIHVPDISTDPNAYAADKRLYGLILIFIALFCGTFLVKYVKDASSFLVNALLSNIPLYLIGLAQALGIHLPSLLENSNAQVPALSGGRLWGPFDGAATFGLYLVNLFAIALACWMLGTRRRDRMIGAVMTIATALEIIGSGTRSAAIAVGVMLVVSLVLTRRFKMLLGATALASVTAAVFLNKILPLFTHADSSISNRLFLWQQAIKLIATHPWIGIGLEQFHLYYAQLIVSQAAELNSRGISVHNQYLEWAMESGIIWFIVGVLLLLSITYSCWKAYRIAQRRQQIILLATILALLANIVTGFADVPLDKVEAATFLFLLAGLALGYAEHIRWKTSRSAKQLPVSNVAATLAIATSYQAVSSSSERRDGLHGQQAEHPHNDIVHAPTVASISDKAPTAQKTSRTIIIQLLSWGIALPIIFPVTALLTRYLGPTQFGMYSLTFPFFTVLALLSGSGMDPLIIRQLSREAHTAWSKTLSYAVGTRLLSTILGVGAAALLAMLLPINAEQRTLFLLGSVSLLFSFSFNGLRIIYSHGFRAEQRVGILSLLETTNRVVTAALVGLIVLLRLSLVWAYVLLVYSDLPFFFILVMIARRRFAIHIRFSLARAREHLLGSIPLMGYNVLVRIAGQVDLPLLLVLAGPVSAGIYALASRITDPLISIALAYVTGLYPLLCTKFEEGRKQFATVYRESTRVLALAIIPLAIFVSVEANAIVALLGGKQFAAAAIAVQLLMWTMTVTFFNQLALRTCMAANLERQIPYVAITSASVNILANLALIPHWQIVGAGLAALGSELIGLCLFTVLLRRQVRLLSVMGVILRVFLGNLPALAFLYWLENSGVRIAPVSSLLLAAPVVLVLTILGCIATGTLSLKDVRMLRRFLSNKGATKPSRDVTDRPTVMLPRVQDIANYPTVMLPRIRL